MRCAQETTDLWQVALTVEATAASVPKNATHGDFCGLVQKTLQVRAHSHRSRCAGQLRRRSAAHAPPAQDCVPNLPTDEQMAEMEMFESSLMVITDQEDNVLFNCEEDVRRLRLHSSQPRAPGLTASSLPRQAVYVEMTFFDVEAAETAVNEAIAGLEAKGWQAEIVDPDSMGAPRPRQLAWLECG